MQRFVLAKHLHARTHTHTHMRGWFVLSSHKRHTGLYTYIRSVDTYEMFYIKHVHVPGWSVTAMHRRTQTYMHVTNTPTRYLPGRFVTLHVHTR